jgi:hypothetical protein
MVDVFAKLHVFKGVDSGFLEMAEAFDLKLGGEYIAEEE